MNDKYNLMKFAINYLSKFSSSKSNLEKILKKKIQKLKIEKKDKFELYNSIENIVLKLEKNNLINDISYVSSKIRNFIFQGKSRAFIKNYFFQKGIEKNIILNSLEKLDQLNSNWEIDSAKIFAKKRKLLNNSGDKEKKLSKMARAGFNYEISKKILDEN